MSDSTRTMTPQATPLYGVCTWNGRHYPVKIVGWLHTDLTVGNGSVGLTHYFDPVMVEVGTFDGEKVTGANEARTAYDPNTEDNAPTYFDTLEEARAVVAAWSAPEVTP